jgi:hypothetical protein
VTAWALMAAVIGAVIAAGVYVFLWLRHRVLHPEALARRQVVSAEIPAGSPAAQAVQASQPAAIEPPREIHLHIHSTDPAGAAEIIRQAIPGHAGLAITDRSTP